MSAESDHGLGIAIEVRRGELADTREAPLPAADLTPGEALLRVDCFAMTSNNVTYAALGEAMRYWQFFPASEQGWGRVPAFGFADVVASAADGLQAEERIYGYLPMATHLRVRPGRVEADGFTDGAEHRSELPGFYNRYLRTAADPGYDPEREAEQMLFRPLFATSFLIADALAEASFHGAQSVVLSSASSKTAYGTAFLLAQRDDVEVIGLTSASNAAFVEALGCYDRVLTYDAVSDLSPSQSVAYVDMSGDAALRSALHLGLKDSLALDLIVGATHHDALGGDPGLPGPAPAFFFAPDRARQRTADWGAAGLDERIAEAWSTFLPFVTRDDGPAVLKVSRAAGPQAAQDTWRALVAGRSRPDEGHVVSVHPA